MAFEARYVQFLSCLVLVNYLYLTCTIIVSVALQASAGRTGWGRTGASPSPPQTGAGLN